MTGTTTTAQGCTNFKLRQLLRRMSRLYDKELGRAGLKTTQYALLAQLTSLGPIAPGELARRMGMDASTLTRNVQLLIERGWVSQGPGRDTRSRSLTLTDAGRAKQAEAKAHWKRAQLALNARLGVEQVATLHVLIDGALQQLSEPDDSTP